MQPEQLPNLAVGPKPILRYNPVGGNDGSYCPTRELTLSLRRNLQDFSFVAMQANQSTKVKEAEKR